VTGLNPHAGEGGQLGAEEAAIIAPAMQAAREALVREGIPVELRGPLPADVAFRPALHGEVDLVVAMYHDQALIPVKLIDFAQTVNVTLGLPYVRTSPPHGTAHDLAWTGRADATPMRSALELAVALAARRRESSRK
jgi:4-hydroxythreonine-4-phosphate dehydrogenase